MNLKLISSLLFIAFFMREVAAAVPYIELNEEQMESFLQTSGIQVKHILLSQYEADELKKSQKIQDKDKEKEEDEEEYKKENGRGSSGIQSWINLSGPEGLIVAFALVGTFLVVAWVAAFPYTVYKALSEKEEYQNLQFLNLNYSRFEDTELLGTRYSLFLADPEEGLFSNSMGFSAEVGSFHDLDNKHKGEYWIIGPAFMRGFKVNEQNAFVKLDLMAGRSFNSIYELFSKAEGIFNVEFMPHLSFGVGLGSVYLNPNEDQTFSQSQKWGFLYGANVTYSF